MTIQTIENLAAAKAGSYYTIRGAGGDLAGWINGYTEMLVQAGVGTPVAWYTTTGAEVNAFAQPPRAEDAFQPELTILMFPLDGLDVGRLAILKLRMGDTWFDDMISNMAPELIENEEGE